MLIKISFPWQGEFTPEKSGKHTLFPMAFIYMHSFWNNCFKKNVDQDIISLARKVYTREIHLGSFTHNAILL